MNKDILDLIETYKTNLSVLWNIKKDLIRFYIVAYNQNCYIKFHFKNFEEKVYI